MLPLNEGHSSVTYNTCWSVPWVGLTCAFMITCIMCAFCTKSPWILYIGPVVGKTFTFLLWLLWQGTLPKIIQQFDAVPRCTNKPAIFHQPRRIVRPTQSDSCFLAGSASASDEHQSMGLKNRKLKVHLSVYQDDCCLHFGTPLNWAWIAWHYHLCWVQFNALLDNQHPSLEITISCKYCRPNCWLALELKEDKSNRRKWENCLESEPTSFSQLPRLYGYNNRTHCLGSYWICTAGILL